MTEPAPFDEATLELLLGQAAGELSDRLHRGEPLAVEACLQRFPAIADLLRELLPALQALSPPPHLPTAAEELGGQLGDYRIVAEIGRGGMGIVYEAEQLSLGRRVALKVLPFAASLDARQLLRFRSEAQTASLLHHSNIVPVYGVGCERGIHFYAMQLIDGRSLAQVIAELRRLAGKEQAAPPSSPVETSLHQGGPGFFATAAHLGMQAALALEHAHSLGIVHRDVKPSNLLLDVRGQLWITDFGLAHFRRTEGRITGTGDLVGTLRYMSPEQALARRGLVDHRADVYGLGASLYELLTLQPIFPGQDREELLRQIFFEEPVPPQRLNPAIPIELATIVSKALARDPQERYSSARALADDLRCFLEDRPIQARPASTLGRLHKWLRRHQGWVLLGTGLLALAALILAFCLVQLWHAQSQTRRALEQVDEQRRRAEDFARQADQERRRAQMHEEETLRYLYAADLKLAWNAWQGADLQRMEQVLRRHLPQDGQKDQRGFAWHYLWQLGHRTHGILQGHQGAVYHIAFSPDGKELASAGQDGTLRLWEPATGHLLGILRGHQGEVNWVEYSPDGALLASGSDDGTIRLWQRASRQMTACTTRSHGAIVAVCFSPDGKTLAIGGESGAGGVVQRWRWTDSSGPATLLQLGRRVEGLAFAPDGQTLAVASQEGLLYLDLQTGKSQSRSHPLAWAASVAFRHDGRSLAVGWSGGQAQVLPFPAAAASTRSPPEEGVVFPCPLGGVESVAFSPDDRWLISGDRAGEVHVWDVPRQAAVKVFRGHQGRVWSVAVSPDSSLIASAGEDGVVRVWKAANHQEHRGLAGRLDPVQALAFTPDGKELLTGSRDGRIRIWSMPQGLAAGVLLHGESVSSLTLSPDGQTLVSGGGPGLARLWDLPRRRQRADLLPPDRRLTSIPGEMPSLVSFAPNGSMLAAAQTSGAIVQVWGPGGTRLLQDLSWESRSPIHSCRALSFSPDGRALARGRGDSVVLWDTASWTPRTTLEAGIGDVVAVAFSPNGTLLCSVTETGMVRLWDAASGTLRATLLSRGSQAMRAAFAPDGRTLAIAGNKGALSLWNVPTQQQLFTLAGHGGAIAALAFSRDGKVLASAGTAADGTGEVLLWQAGEGP